MTAGCACTRASRMVCLLSIVASESACVPRVPSIANDSCASEEHGGFGSGTTAFTNVSVIPMDAIEHVIAASTVVVRDGTIAAFGPSTTTAVPVCATVIDGTGRFLLPGLVDAHTHIHRASDLLLYLASGVTTVRNMKGEPKHLVWREQIRDRRRLGPTLYTSSPFIENVTSAAEAERLVRDYAESGYDFIKVHGDLSSQAYERLGKTAKAERIQVIGHVPRNLPFEAVLANGQASIDHAEEFVYSFFKNSVRDTSRIVELARLVEKAGITVTPTLVAYRHISLQVDSLPLLLSQPEAAWLPPLERIRWLPENNYYSRNLPRNAGPSLKRYLLFQQQLTRELDRAGVRLLVGTDAGGPETLVPGSSLHEELQLLVRSGISPFRVLRAATANAAEAWGASGEFGVIRVGARADLLLVRHNPLTALGALRDPLGVMVHGRWLPGELLRSWTDSLTTEYRRITDFVAGLEAQGAASAVAFRNSTSFSTSSHEEQAYLDYRIPEMLGRILECAGEDSLIAEYEALKARFPRGVLFTQQSMNDLGYRYLWPKRTREAIAVLALNAREYPMESGVHDALGEAHSIAADTTSAIASFTKALAINPDDSFASSMLKKLGRGP